MPPLLKKPQGDRKSTSPGLPDGVRNYLIDIDGSVCEDSPNDIAGRMVDVAIHPDAVEACNRLFDQGHVITFITSRNEARREVTESWLRKNGFNYHGILFGKPRGGNYHWIGDHEGLTRSAGTAHDGADRSDPTKARTKPE